MNCAKAHQPISIHEGRGRDGIEAEIDVGHDDVSLTELARLLLAARREWFLAERRFLDRDELDRGQAQRRGVP